MGVINRVSELFDGHTELCVCVCRIDTMGVINRVSELFDGHTELCVCVQD